MIQSIFSSWNFMRIVRLVIGIAILVQAFIAKDVLFGIAGLLFTSMAIFNAGCCGTSGCYKAREKNIETRKDIIYEEVV